jgi:uncharacterized protein
MTDENYKILKKLKEKGLAPEHLASIERELKMDFVHYVRDIPNEPSKILGIYDYADLNFIQQLAARKPEETISLQTLDELLDRDKKREADGFPRRIRIGKISKPSKGKKEQIVVVPSTTEPKFYHDDSISEDEEEPSTGGTGEGEEGEVIGEEQAQPQQGEGEGQGAGQGEQAGHDVVQEAFDLGRILTEKFQLPNLKNKGKKRAFSKYIYDLTDRNRGFGQVLDKKATLHKVLKTNILLGNLNPEKQINTEDLILNPQDHIYRILSKEKDFETQALVFFVRDYSGSMQGAPTEAIAAQHLFIYSWLMYQYQNNVETRFILHDNEAKLVPDFYTYHNSAVAGGTNVFPAYELVNKIIEEERLMVDYNIYVFHGTDGDDWDSDGSKAIEAIKKMLSYTNRIGITVARNSWSSAITTVEQYFDDSKLLNDKPGLIRLDSFDSQSANENRIIEGIKKLVS